MFQDLPISMVIENNHRPKSNQNSKIIKLDIFINNTPDGQDNIKIYPYKLY